MRISDAVADYISELLEAANGSAEIQRNELASILGCVPSQINYVLTSRFTPEKGYIVESRRGGGGYIRITRVTVDSTSALLHIINVIGDEIDSASLRAMLHNMAGRGLIASNEAYLISAATMENSLCSVPSQYRDKLRARIAKNMLITILNNS